MKLICPRCMKPVPVPDNFTGTEVTCSECKTPFAVPAGYNPAVLPEPAPGAVGGTPPARPATPVAIPPTPPAIPPKPTETYSMSPDVPSEKPATPAVPEKPTLPASPQKPVPPAGYIPPLPMGTAPSTGVYEPPAVPPGYSRARGITISPQVVAWLPAVLLVFTLFCTFFTWVGSYRGNVPLYTQGPWSAMFGDIDRNVALEQALDKGNKSKDGSARDASVEMREPLPGTDVTWIAKLKSDWELMVPYFLCLLGATALALADRGLHSLDPRNIPPLAKIWPWRKTGIGVLGALAFLFMFVEYSRGFGMERAIRQSISEKFAEERERAKSNPGEVALVKYREEEAYRQYNIGRTTWLRLGLTCNFVAVLALGIHICLNRRGDKPPPRLVLQY